MWLDVDGLEPGEAVANLAEMDRAVDEMLEKSTADVAEGRRAVAAAPEDDEGDDQEEGETEEPHPQHHRPR